MRYKNLNDAYTNWKENQTDETKDVLGKAIYEFCSGLIRRRYWRYPSTFEDSIGEACLQIWRDIDKYDSTKSLFTTWAHQIVINKANTLFGQRKQRRQQMLVGHEEVPLQGLSLVNSITLRMLISKLPIEKQIFVESKLKGLTNEELAKHYDISIENVKIRWIRIKDDLKGMVR